MNSSLDDSLTTGSLYGFLFVLGVLLAAVGGFEHAWYVWEVPIGAIGCVLALGAILVVVGMLTRSRLAVLVPSIAWLLFSIMLAIERPEGDLAVAGDLAGYLYLYGGAVAVVVAVLVTKSERPWFGPLPPPRDDPPPATPQVPG